MTATSGFIVRGSGAGAWLTSLILARFAVPDPRLVFVDSTADTSNARLVIRPEMSKLHKAVGLDLTKHGGRPVSSWTGPLGQVMPFGTYGAPLEGVSFHHLLLRAHGSASADSLGRFVLPNRHQQAFVVEARSYGEILRRTAQAVGVGKTEPGADWQIVHTDGCASGAAQNDVISVGAARAEPILPEAFLVHILQKNGMAMADCLPIRDDITRREFDRRCAAIQPCLHEMADLLTKTVSERTRHRRRLWTEAGRLISADDDPFTATEWIAALLAAEGAPAAYHRLADAIPAERLTAHLRRIEVEAKRG